MLVPVASLVAGSALLAAAAGKAVDTSGSRIALAGYGVPGRLTGGALAGLIVVEVALGIGVAAGVASAGVGAAAVLVAFACAQAAMLASGRGGAPCGCMGARGRIGPASLARTLLLAGGCLVAAGVAAPGGPLAAAAAGGLLAAALVPRRPDGALELAGEGPDVGARSPLADHLPRGGHRLVLFTSDGCRLCRRLRPALRELERPGLAVHDLDEEEDAQAWLAAAVPGSPYAVLLDGDGVVLAKGTVNTARQLASLVQERGQTLFFHPLDDRVKERGQAPFFQRRTLLARAATLVAAGGLVRPGEAEAYHFCGHIYTTDGCPHPTGLPRIDARGFPLRARDGHPVDDLGRLIDGGGQPIDDGGAPLLDPDGRRLPSATRTRVCDATGERFGLRLRVDGAWYRCCGGSVRKLVDCCTTGRVRINGDGALRGYCYRKRRVFCVMFFQTRIPC